MSTTAQDGYIAFGLQTEKGTMQKTLNRHKAVRITYGIVQIVEQMPPEVGGSPHPTGAYKTGAWAEGGMRIMPRLEDSFGVLLKGLFGHAEDPEPVEGHTGAYEHVFKVNPDVKLYQPWMTFAKYIPKSDISGHTLMEIGVDSKILAAEIAIPAGQAAVADIAVRSLTPSLDYDPEDLTLGDFESSESLALACTGDFVFIEDPLGSASEIDVKATGAVLSWVNQLTDPREEFIIGSYFPDDAVARQRTLAVRTVVKWDSPDLYQKILAGGLYGSAGKEWSPVPYRTGFRATVKSAGNIGSTVGVDDVPYSLTFEANDVVWQAEGPVHLAGGAMVAQTYVGLVNEDSQGGYALARLVNAIDTAY